MGVMGRMTFTKKTIGLGTLAVVMLIGSFLLASPAFSLSNRAPDPGDDTSGGRYWYVVSQTPYVRIDSTESKAYFNNNGSHTITVEHAGICPSGSDENAGNQGAGSHTRFDVFKVQADGSTGALIDTAYGPRDMSGACVNRVLNIPNGSLNQINDYQGGPKFAAIIRATHIGAWNTQNAFKLVADSGIIGMKSSGSRNSGLQSGGANTYENINIPLITPCNVKTGSVWRSISIYDPDNGVAGIQPSKFRVRVMHNGNPLPASRYNPGSRWTGTAATGYAPGSQSNEDYALGVNWRAGERYTIQLLNVYGNNTLQVGIPFDSMDFTCDPENLPTGDIISVDCTSTKGQIIRVRSNDANGNTESRIRIGPNASPNWTSPWGADGARNITVPAGAGGMNFTAGTWAIRLDVRDKRSNGNFAAGYVTVDNDSTERCALPPTTPTSTVTLRPIVDPPLDPHIEPTETTNFVGRVNVSGFPRTDQWGYTEFARQNANNTGITANRETYSTNQGAQDAGASGNVAFARLCKDGAYRNTCAKYRCQNGTTGDTCGNYNWRCSWNGNTRYPGWSSSQPACNIFGYYCRDSSGAWRTGSNYEYRNFNGAENPNGCNNRWNCPNPSGTPNAYGPDSSVAPCLIFSCANSNDPQNFYEANGNGGGAADNRCDFRCANGTGSHAPLSRPGANNKYGAGDLRCYRPPTFNIQCRWDDGQVIPDTVRANGDYCVRNKTNTGVTIGVSICRAYSVRDPSATGGWSPNPPSPGYGRDGGGTWRQLRDWIWNVNPPNDEKCVRVVAKPTVKIRGGDAAAGGAFANSGICSAGPSSSIIGWPHSPVYDASGTQLGGFASRDIFGFATATINANDAVAPRGLAFANSPPSGGDRYGGSFGSMPCLADHNGAKPTNINPLNLSTLNTPNLDGSYQATTNQINNSPTIRNGSHLTVYVNGDLYIGGTGIFYERTGWVNTTMIPSFKVVVYGGNIYIDPAVTQLDGVYVAQPNGGTGGNIYTCATAGGPIPNVSLYNSCRNGLTVNGAFIARQVNLGRTEGTAIFGETAEEFNYLPEMWLGQWPQDNTSMQVKYDAMISLPPIL